MSLAFITTCFLIVAGPVLTVVGGPFVVLIQILSVAVGVVSVAVSARPADIAQFSRATSGLLWILMLVPIWLLLQLAPLPLSLSHPIWTSAHDALQGGPFGHVTVDMGETLRSFSTVIAMIGLMGVTIVLARDRHRAELVLFVVAAVTTLVSLAALLQQTGVVAVLPAGVGSNLAGVAVVSGLATIALAFERRETRPQGASQDIRVGIGGVIAVLAGGATLQQTGGPAGVTIAGFGVALFLLVLVIRRLDLAMWPTVGLCIAVAAGAAIMAGWLFEQSDSTSPLLRFLAAQPAEATASFERMLADSRWLGSGAGTFEKLARLYQSDDALAALSAPTTAASIAVEIGWIGLLVATALGCVVVARLFRGALARGRDWFFAAAGASCVIIAMCAAFAGPALLQPGIAAIFVVMAGLGLTQTFSQSSRP